MSDQPKSMADIGFKELTDAMAKDIEATPDYPEPIDYDRQQTEELILIVGWLLGTLMRHKLPVPPEVAWMLKRQGFALFKDAEPPT